MKTWILYVGAVLLGLASSLLLDSFAVYGPALELLVPLVREVSLFILFPVVLVLYTAGSASLLRHRNTPTLYFSTLFWALSTTLVLTFISTMVTRFLPSSLLTLPSAVSAEGIDIVSPTFESVKALAVSDNAFTQLSLRSTHLLPMIILALIAGYSIKPSYEAIRPAYVITNSFAEAMLRLSKICALLFAIPVMILSADFFSSHQLTSLLSAALPLLGVYLILTLLMLLLVLPLLYSLYTGFHQGSPYRILFRGFAGLISSFFFQSTLESTPTLIALSEQNNRTKKRIAGTAIPLYSILGKGGSALLASATLVIILRNQVDMSMTLMLSIVLFTAFVSLISSFAMKSEVAFIMISAYVGIGSAGLSIPAAVIIILPFIQGLAALLNAAIALLGASYTSRIISTDDPAEYPQTL